MGGRWGRSMLAIVLWLLAAAVAAQPAPEFTLPALQDARPVSLVEQRGEVVLLDFWASWCAPCARSLPVYARLQADYRERGLRVLAVNLDEQRAEAEAFLQRHPLALEVLLDPAGTVAAAYALQGMPTALLIDRRGAVRRRWIGFDETELAALREAIEALLVEAP